MSQEKTSKSPSQRMSSSRRDVLAGASALLGLGAGVLIQPNGGVAYAKDSKSGGSNIKSTGPTAPKNPPIKPDLSKTKKGGKKRDGSEDVKKEGG